jgi:glycosyltransferase involved in cell wall biosynthesis
MPTKISLIMTVHSREHFLEAALASVLAQTYQDWELVIWDDGSSDRSLEIAQHYVQRDQRLRLFSASHRGRAASLQAAHAQARGSYLGWIDSDDQLAPAALAATAAILDTHSEIGMVYTDHQVINEQGQLLGYGKRCQIPYSPDRLLIDFMTFHFRLFRRSVFQQAGGIASEVAIAIDYDLCLRLSEITQVHHLRVPLYLYRTHSQSLSQQFLQQQVTASQQAISRALERRGLADHYQINVDANHRFRLEKKKRQ